MQWLEGLGRVVTDYGKGSMEFQLGNKTVILKSGTDEKTQEVGIRSLERMMGKGARCYAIRIEPRRNDQEQKGGNEHPEIKQILSDYSSVLCAPQGLPPRREFDHHIPLRDEAQPVNVHPYRYAHFQKEEIERQVCEMLKQGLIRPSTSPFSSPVLLVRKKDGSWRFCTD